MREMHKWKDKVELSLDNRQIFFLFFGLSVVGCFVFALGVMTGRRLQWDPATQAKTLSPDSLELLQGEDAADDPKDTLLAFEEGLRESDTADKPATRPPGTPPASEEELARRKAEAQALAAAPAKPQVPTAAIVAPPAAAKEQAEAVQAEKETALASAAKATTAEAKDEASRIFTLQFKAFSRETDADSFADALKRNGHDVRVESSVVNGRTWHRVRLGHFKTWEEGLAAKAEFEKAEHHIAYVVSE